MSTLYPLHVGECECGREAFVQPNRSYTAPVKAETPHWEYFCSNTDCEHRLGTFSDEVRNPTWVKCHKLPPYTTVNERFKPKVTIDALDAKGIVQTMSEEQKVMGIVDVIRFVRPENSTASIEVLREQMNKVLRRIEQRLDATLKPAVPFVDERTELEVYTSLLEHAASLELRSLQIKYPERFGVGRV